MVASLVAQLVKNLPAMWETWVGKISWRRERLPTPYSDLENSMDCIVHGVAKSQTRLSDFCFIAVIYDASLRSFAPKSFLHYSLNKFPGVELQIKRYGYFSDI